MPEGAGDAASPGIDPISNVLGSRGVPAPTARPIARGAEGQVWPVAERGEGVLGGLQMRAPARGAGMRRVEQGGGGRVARVWVGEGPHNKSLKPTRRGSAD